MKLTKATLKRIIKEELDAMMQDGGSGDGMAKFMQAVKAIQGVLERHDLSGNTQGTYDPMDLGDSSAAWRGYDKARKRVLQDPEYNEAKNYLTGLKVIVEGGETFLIGEVELPMTEYEANADVYLTIVDPDNLTKRGKMREVDSVMISDDYTNADQKIVSVVQ